MNTPEEQTIKNSQDGVEKEHTSDKIKNKIKPLIQYLYSSTSFWTCISLICILICLGITVLVTWSQIEDDFKFSTPIQLERAVDRNWWNESYRVSSFCFASVSFYLLLFLLHKFIVAQYLRLLKRSFSTNVSKEFKQQQYLRMGGRIRDFLFIIITKYAIFIAFFIIEPTPLESFEGGGGGGGGGKKVAGGAKEEDFGIAELLHFSRYLSTVSELFNKYPENLENVIGLIQPLTIVLILHRFVMCWISIIFHTTHFKDRIETNDFLLNIFEILKKHQKKSKKISLSNASLSEISGTSRSDAAAPSLEQTPQQLGDESRGYPLNVPLKAGSGDLYEEEMLKREIERAEMNAALVFDLLCSLVNKPTNSVIVADDLIGLVTAPEAKRFFPLLTLNHSENLTKNEFITAISNVYQEKHDIICSLNDHKGILKDLDIMLLLVFLFLWILVAIPSLFIVMAVFAFVFKFFLEPTLKNLVKSAIFISVSHPFDVGDWIEIDGVRYKVREIHLLTTVLQSMQQEIVYMNNIQLALTKISNIRRSPSQRETITLFVNPTTQRNIFDHLKLRLSIFLSNYPRDYEPRVQVYGFQIVNNEKMQVLIEYYHKSNFQDIELYRERRTNFQKNLFKLVQEMDIKLTRPTLIYNELDRGSAK